jgi:phage/plasmid primase-like uncharacterized protein
MRTSPKTISTKERAHGRWREILPALGIDGRFLTGKNCPCPMCGGRDRFRLIDSRTKTACRSVTLRCSRRLLIRMASTWRRTEPS